MNSMLHIIVVRNMGSNRAPKVRFLAQRASPMTGDCQLKWRRVTLYRTALSGWFYALQKRQLTKIGGAEMTTKPCVACAEPIQPRARLCRFCGTSQDDARYSSTRKSGALQQAAPSGLLSRFSDPENRGPLVFFGILLAVIAGVSLWLAVSGNQLVKQQASSQVEEEGLAFQPLRDGEIPFSALSPGMCLNDGSLPEGYDFAGLPSAECSGPHDSEVVKIGVVPSESYPLSESVIGAIQQECIAGFEEYSSLDYEAEVDLVVSAYTPSKREWDKGDRIFVCVVFKGDGTKLTGSISSYSGLSALPSGQLTVREIYVNVIPSVVTVECGLSQGTGFSYDVEPAEGYSAVIVTNHHVIEECTFQGSYVAVYTEDGQSVGAELWNWDEYNDLAIIMIDKALPTLLDAPEGNIGDQVVAVGSPLGFSGTITTGIISQIYEDAYQTDAAVNPGNSGGPLLDMQGRLLGVTTLGYGREGLNIAFRQQLLCQELIICN